MKKNILLLVFILPTLVFSQYNVPSQEMQEAQLLKSKAKPPKKIKPNRINQNKASGDILHSFTFDTGLPADWTTTDAAGIGGWEFYEDSARSATYTNPLLAMINSNSGGGYMHFPVEYYNCVPGSNPPVNNTNLVNGDASITTNWLDVSEASEVVLSFASWYRLWGGTYDINFAIDGDETTWYTLNGRNINGDLMPINEFPGPHNFITETGDGYNAAFPQYNLTSTVGFSFSTVKIQFNVYGTSHHFASIDDVLLFEPSENDVSIVETYAGNKGIYTTSATYTGGEPGLYQGYNTNYSEVPANILHQVQLGALVHQAGTNGENTRVNFSIDSAEVSNIWSATSTTSIPDFGPYPTNDSILYTDTTNNFASGPNFYNPELDPVWFETNGFYENGIPYIFNYTAATDNEDSDLSNNHQVYEYSQTWGRYSYHWQPNNCVDVSINSSLSPFSFNLAQTEGDLFLNIFDCYQDDNIAPEDEFKIYGIRFFLPSDEHNTFNATTGNGVEIRPIIYFWDENLQDWDLLTDAFAETTTLHQTMLDKWVYLPFENSSGEIDAIDFGAFSNNYRVGIYVENYHGQELAIGVDTKYRQPYGHTAAWMDGSWRRLAVDGSVMIDMYTKPDQLAYEYNDCYIYHNVKDVSDTENNEAKIYPNPTTGIIKLTNAKNAKIKVYSITGHLVKSANNNSVNTSLDLSELANGTYLIKVIKENTIVTTKVNLLK